MSDVKAIAQAVESLPPGDLALFRAWFVEFDVGAWDQQIASDFAGGKLDVLLAEAEQDFRDGEPREL